MSTPPEKKRVDTYCFPSPTNYARADEVPAGQLSSTSQGFAPDELSSRGMPGPRSTFFSSAAQHFFSWKHKFPNLRFVPERSPIEFLLMAHLRDIVNCLVSYVLLNQAL